MHIFKVAHLLIVVHIRATNAECSDGNADVSIGDLVGERDIFETQIVDAMQYSSGIAPV